jgi:hypothetical protein
MRCFIRMTVLASCLLTLYSIAETMLSVAIVQTPVPTIAEILGKVQSNVQESRKLSTELACKEKRTFLASSNGATSLLWSAETDIVRTPDGAPFRRIVSVKGKAPQSWLEKGDSVYGNEEMFGTAEHVFSVPSRDGRTFKLTGSQTLDGRSTYVVEFEAKPVNFKREFGKAWVDKQSFQIPRIELHLINESFDPFTTAEYSRIEIDGKPFWVPTKRTIMTNAMRGVSDERKTVEITELSDCRRFEVSVKVRPVQ